MAIAGLSVLAVATELPRALSSQALWDFGSFVASARAAAEGLNPYAVYPLTTRIALPGFEAWNPNLNPPISALLFQLFDMAEPHAALVFWRWISIVAFLATVALLLRRYAAGPESVPLFLWCFGLAGFWDTLFLGQIYTPLVLAAAGAWLLLERGRGSWAGILIGIVVAIKPNFLVWPALLFLSGHRRPALVSGATAGAISLVPLAVFGPEIYRQWLDLIVSDSARWVFLTNASLAGLASRVGVPTLGVVLSLALLLGLGAWAIRLRPAALRTSELALVAALLASPLAWIHYTLFLLPILLSRWRQPPIWLVVALLTVPVPFVVHQFQNSAAMQFTVGSAYAWALVLCLIVLLPLEYSRRKAR